MKNSKNKKVVLVIASEGYQQVEYNVTKKNLEKGGATVITASDKLGGAIAKDGSTTIVDTTLDKIKLKDVDGIFFIGGPGALDVLDNGTSYHLINEARKLNMPRGAICLSVRIFAKEGGLKGKRATGWDGDNNLQALFDAYGVLYKKGEAIIIDDNIITAVGPESAEQFAQGILFLINKPSASA